jgi:pimeloyl-ACP methyl ester carboxylesterase
MPYRTPGLLITEHELEVPLDHSNPGGERITVFAREVADPDGTDRPFLVFFEGGPGYEAPRPTRVPTDPGWLDRALDEFRVLMLDQRGTGRSAPIDGDATADRLTHFRADSIVRDAEAFREMLGVERWSVLGQSYGGFCVTTYLSLAPEGLREAFITGGLPPIGRHVDDVYRATYARARERARRYFERYPQDRSRLEPPDGLVLPGGDRLTSRRLRQLGAMLGMSDGAERLHHILELPPGSPAFLHDVEAATAFARNPIYAVLHEACYADGGSSRWSADRLRPEELELTGEHVFPWMFEEYGALAPLREAAHALADREWPRLYDEARLRENEVPAAAIAYADDLYVERAFSEETAARVRGLRLWLTNEYEHNGLRADGARILGRLVDLARGRA